MVEINLKELGTLPEGCVYVGVDIGATNTRVAIGSAAKYVQVTKFQCNSVDVLISTLEEVEKAVFEVFDRNILGSTLDVAGPVTDGGTKVKLTNFVEGSDCLNVDMLPQKLFPRGATHLLNDLEAACYGIIALDRTNRLQDYFECLWGKQAVALKDGHYVVLAMGTGLGVGLIQHIHLSYSKHQVLALEGGHALVPSLGRKHSGCSQMQRVCDSLSDKLYGGRYPIEYEDVCSGRGLKWVYDFLVDEHKTGDKSKTTPEIAKSAVTEPIDPIARDAMMLHYDTLARASQSMVVVMQAKGVFWAGDNQVNNGEFVRAHVEDLQASFLDHPKLNWVKDVPVFSQTQSINVNLLGVLFFAAELHSCEKRGGY